MNVGGVGKRITFTTWTAAAWLHIGTCLDHAWDQLG